MSAHDLRSSQSRDLALRKAEVCQDLVGMLAELWRVAPQLRLGAGKSRGRAHCAHLPGLRMLILTEGFVRNELRIFPDSVEVVDRRARNVGLLDDLEPMRGRLGGKQLDDFPHRLTHLFS